MRLGSVWLPLNVKILHRTMQVIYLRNVDAVSSRTHPSKDESHNSQIYLRSDSASGDGPEVPIHSLHLKNVSIGRGIYHDPSS